MSFETSMVANLRRALILCLVVSLGSVSSYMSRCKLTRPSNLITRRQAFSGTQQSFNPFSSRTRNKNIQWFEADLETFYKFVEQQPLLTNEQEMQYGKALRMWQKTEQLREKMQSMREEQATQKALCGTEGEMAIGMGGFDDGEGVGLMEATSTSSASVSASKVSKAKKSDRKKSWSKPIEVDSKHAVSDEELAEVLNCSVEKLHKIQQYYDVAKTRLVNSNLKLVLAVVSRYRSSNIPNAELIAEGTRGLSRAALRYDYSKGFRFATYATWYVHQAVYEYVRWRKHPAKMPSRYLLLQRKVKDYQRTFQEREGRLPGPMEISEALELSRFDVSKVLTMQLYPLLLCTTVNYKGSYKQEGKERTYEEFLPTQSELPTDYNKDLREEMEVMMRENLNQVERDVLRLRLGLDNGRPKAVKEVGKRFKISWKDVRNVEKEAIAKLKDSEQIANFIENYESV